jgi:hypothetical protein
MRVTATSNWTHVSTIPEVVATQAERVQAHEDHHAGLCIAWARTHPSPHVRRTAAYLDKIGGRSLQWALDDKDTLVQSEAAEFARLEGLYPTRRSLGYGPRIGDEEINRD